jgi:prepilin-type processing-associated H-X9-DG protein
MSWEAFDETHADTRSYEILWPSSFETLLVLGIYDVGAFSAEDLRFMRRAIQRRHGGRWNILFCDGHVESGGTADWFDVRKDSVRRRWNNDNLSHPEFPGTP